MLRALRFLIRLIRLSRKKTPSPPPQPPTYTVTQVTYYSGGTEIYLEPKIGWITRSGYFANAELGDRYILTPYETTDHS